MRKLILLVAVTALIGGLVVAQAAAEDDGCRNVWAKGTTTGDLLVGPTLSGTARWHTSGMGAPVEAQVVATPISHTFTVPGLGTIETHDTPTLEPAPTKIPFPVGLYELESVLLVDGVGYEGEIVTKRGSLVVESVFEDDVEIQRLATAEWYVKGEICELRQNG